MCGANAGAFAEEYGISGGELAGFVDVDDEVYEFVREVNAAAFPERLEHLERAAQAMASAGQIRVPRDGAFWRNVDLVSNLGSPLHPEDPAADLLAGLNARLFANVALANAGGMALEKALHTTAIPFRVKQAIPLFFAAKGGHRLGSGLREGCQGNWQEGLADVGLGLMDVVAAVGMGIRLRAVEFQNHHWWPKELGGADRAGAVVPVQSANYNLHTATGGVHPNVRAFLQEELGADTWKAAKEVWFSANLDFATRHDLLRAFYRTQGMRMPTMIQPGIVSGAPR